MTSHTFYAHTSESLDKGTWQPLKEHLTNVAELASVFASDFHGEKLAYASGILHDLGKYSTEFQQLLEGAKIKVDHSTAGAIESRRTYIDWQSRILEYIVAGHHGGLMDYGSPETGLESRLCRRSLADYLNYKAEIELPGLEGVRPELRVGGSSAGFSFSFYIRMLFSCLVDADSLDTERFCDPGRASARGNYDDFETLAKRFDEYMASKSSRVEQNEINRHRKAILEQCLKKGAEEQQMFTLTVPTGGGKTLSSMAFALEHLRKHELKRIVYVIPYTSIIEQTATIFKSIFGSKNVLEHHSNFDPWTMEDDSADSGYPSLRLSTENWDVPIIITTNIQFFESLFSKGRSRCRKIHNLSKSVIIFDEAQMLPTNYLRPCLAAVTELVRNYGSSVVLCTATPPKLGDLLSKDERAQEIVGSPDHLYRAFKRVVLKDAGNLDDESLTGMLKKERKVLCVVNTRNHAKILYDSLTGLNNVFHLSARMCAVHRRDRLREIKKQLIECDECRVISTQLIEAGVDIDFPTVFRAMSGLDSIIQAAGRCNREGKLPFGEVHVFRSTERHGQATSWQKRTAEIGDMVIGRGGDALSLDSVATYFHSLYFHEGPDGLDSKGILRSLKEGGKDGEFSFEEVSDMFNLIEEGTRDIIVPYDDNAVSLIREMSASRFPWRHLRRLQSYTVGIYYNEFKEMMDSGVLDNHDDRFYILKDLDTYSPETGLLSGKYNGKEMRFLMA